MGVGDFNKRLNNKNLGPLDKTEKIQLRSEDFAVLESISASGSNAVHTATFGSLPATGDYWVFGAIAGDPLFPHQQLGESPNARYGVRYDIDGDTTALPPQPNDFNIVPVVVTLASTANAAAVASTTAVTIAARSEIPVSVSATGAVLTLTFNRKGTVSAPTNGTVRPTDVVLAVSASGEVPTREAIEVRETNFSAAASDASAVSATNASVQNVGQFRPTGAGWFGDMDTFQVGGSVAGVAEATSVTLPTASAFTVIGAPSVYWTLSAPSGDFYVWYQAGVSIDPAPAGTGIMVSVSSIDGAAQVASATQAAIDAIADFGAVASVTNVVVTNASTGAVTDAAEGGFPVGVSISVLTQGVDEDATDWTVTEVNRFPNPKFERDTS